MIRKPLYRQQRNPNTVSTQPPDHSITIATTPINIPRRPPVYLRSLTAAPVYAGGVLEGPVGEGAGTVNVASPPVGTFTVTVVLGPYTSVDAADAAEE